jgi:shikimate dehydrogenase
VPVLTRPPAGARPPPRDLGADAAGKLDELAAWDHDVLVNTTSVGLREDRSPVPADALRPGSVVLDAVYDPEETRLLRDAKARGARPVSGKWMLVGQAAEQIRLWTGLDPPREVLVRAFDAAGPATAT